MELPFLPSEYVGTHVPLRGCQWEAVLSPRPGPRLLGPHYYYCCCCRIHLVLLEVLLTLQIQKLESF